MLLRFKAPGQRCSRNRLLDFSVVLSALIREGFNQLTRILEVEVFQSNDEGKTVACVERLGSGEFVAGIINPSGFTATEGPLPRAIAELEIPFYEVHASNPSSRDIKSTILPVCKGGVCGFGYAGYGVALRSISASLPE